jgi:nucleoside-diphosphate-sugar epimerase
MTSLTTTRRRAAGLIGAILTAGLGACGEQAPVEPAAVEPPAIVVIGATAKSSGEIMRQALDAGYRVTGVARRPGDITLTHPNLRIVAGDVYDPASLEAAMTGREVVISMVGPRLDPMNLTEIPDSYDLFTTGTRNIIAAMQAKGNRRLLVASSIGVEDEYPTDKPTATDMRSQWLWNMRNVYQDMEEMEDIVRQSGLEYVIFRPAFLVEEPRRDDLQFAVNADSPKGRILTYADFAAFVLAQATGNEYLAKTVGMYTERELKFGENVDFGKLAKEAAEKAQRAGEQP